VAAAAAAAACTFDFDQHEDDDGGDQQQPARRHRPCMHLIETVPPRAAARLLGLAGAKKNRTAEWLFPTISIFIIFYYFFSFHRSLFFQHTHINLFIIIQPVLMSCIAFAFQQPHGEKIATCMHTRGERGECSRLHGQLQLGKNCYDDAQTPSGSARM
jgi:hypothetical protein